MFRPCAPSPAFFFVLVALLLVFGVLGMGLPSQGGGTADAEKAEPPVTDADAGVVEVVFTDGSVLRLTLLEKHLTLTTTFGKLTVPTTALRRVEVATRIPEELARRIAAAVADLASPEFRRRETATAELLRLKEKAYPALVEAAGQRDPEAARRAEEVLEQLRQAVPLERLEVRKQDVVYTEDSKNTGRIEGDVFRVLTAQFGEVRMKLADVRTIRTPGSEVAEADGGAEDDPGTLNASVNRVGKILIFRVTGSVDGSVWGADVYTIDSRLSTAAVHAGLVKPGQKGLVRVKVLPQVAAFQGSTRNGVTTAPYGPYAGFQFVRAGRAMRDEGN